VHGDEDFLQKVLVLLLEWEREAIDNTPKDLQELSNTIMSLGLVDEGVKDVIHGLANEGPQVEELAIRPVKGGLEMVTLAGIFAIEEIQQLRAVKLKGGG